MVNFITRTYKQGSFYCTFCEWEVDDKIKGFNVHGVDKDEAEARACRVLYEYLKEKLND